MKAAKNSSELTTQGTRNKKDQASQLKVAWAIILHHKSKTPVHQLKIRVPVICKSHIAASGIHQLVFLVRFLPETIRHFGRSVQPKTGSEHRGSRQLTQGLHGILVQGARDFQRSLTGEMKNVRSLGRLVFPKENNQRLKDNNLFAERKK